jgi:hypothetical protein
MWRAIRILNRAVMGVTWDCAMAAPVLRPGKAMQSSHVELSGKPGDNASHVGTKCDDGESGKDVSRVELGPLDQNDSVSSLVGVIGSAGQEGMAPTEEGNDEFSDAGSLNLEEEQEVAEYFKEIEEENKAEEEREEYSEAALAAIPEALALMSGARKSKRHASDSDVEVVLMADVTSRL